MIRKAVVPVAGLGTRLLPATKEQPKEMLPIFAVDRNGIVCLKPMVQAIFEDLFDFGVREFYFIVGRGKRVVQDHFTPDHHFVDRLESQGKKVQAAQLEDFYELAKASTIVWVNQSEPKGFGDAVLQAERLVDGEPFLVHAGDTQIISRNESVHARLCQAHTERSNEATLTIKEVEDPQQYGVAEISDESHGNVEVQAVVEKPEEPRSRFAIMPIYVFNPTLFDTIRVTPPGKANEIHLTDAIQKLIESGYRVQAIKLGRDDLRLDIGTPETYWEALRLTYNHAST